ncbi:hypothetical protein ACE01N_20510 [Saccharicrinis sp. FJH2]|uniref:hypothetical protein n=1 Tax=Saccharicrinis sp. FJH65 TaxID=3344659 RepID=UPI0035F47F05
MKKLLYLLLASFFIYSCEKDESEAKDEFDKLIQPLEIGYSWTFIDSTFTNEGTLTKVDTSTVSVIGSEIANYDGKEIELFYWKWDFYDRIWLKANEEGNNYIYGLREDDKSYLITKSLNHPYPLDIGDTWSKYNFRLQEENDTIFGVISDTTETECKYKDYFFNTMIGDLECVVSFYTRQIDNDLSEKFIYYSPNIGYVGLENKVNSIVTFKKTLMNYDFSNKQDVATGLKSAQIKIDKERTSDSYGMRIRK